jgi:hypothetical protein
VTSRRFRTLATSTTIAVALLAVSSCSTVSDDAARVGGRSLSATQLNDLVVGYAESTQGADAEVSGPQDAKAVREILSTWVATSVVLGLIDAAGGSVDAEALGAAEESLNAQSGFENANATIRDLFILNSAANATLSRLLAPASSELADTYEQGPSISGVVCVRAILTDSKESADLAALRVAGGESFADVAEEVSLDPSSAEGGALTGSAGNQCIDYASVVESVAAEFVDALESTPIGEMSSSFEIPGVGWAIIVHRGFDDIGEDVAALAGDLAATTATNEALANADVWIDAEYGRWDSTTSKVVALG